MICRSCDTRIYKGERCEECKNKDRIAKSILRSKRKKHHFCIDCGKRHIFKLRSICCCKKCLDNRIERYKNGK
jgi:hypothetical protein